VNAEAADLYDRHIEQGIALRTERQLPAALAEFTAACDLRPTAGARCELAFTYLEAGKLVEAESIYASVLKAGPSNVDALAGLGQISRRKGDMAAALHYLQQAAANDPKRLNLQCDVASVLRDLSRFDEATQALSTVLAHEPRHAGALIGLGLLARQRGDHIRAAALFRDVLQDNADHIGVQLELALSLRQAGFTEQAASIYRSILAHDASKVGALSGLAALLRERNEAPAAIELLRRAVELAPAHKDIRLELASTLRELSRLDEAAAEYRAVHSAHPQNWPALVGLGLIARQRGDHAVALEHFQAAQALQPDHAGIQGELALTLTLLERLDEAEHLYQLAAEESPKTAAPIQGLSLIALARGQLDRAIELASRACELEPGVVDRQLLLAALYRDCGRTAEATALVEHSLNAAPGHAGAWIEKGLLLRLVQDRAGALSAFERAAEKDPRRGYIEAASEHLALGNPAQARASYQRVLAVAPMQFDALLGIAELEMLSANYEQCVTICDSLIVAYPKRIAGYRHKCRALIHIDQADAAVRISGELDVIAPSSAEADATKLEILRTCGRRQEAEAVLSLPRVANTRVFPLWLESVLTRLDFYDLAGAEALLQDPPARRAYERSRVLYVQGLLADLNWHVDDAITAFEGALAIHGDDPGAHHHLARLNFLRADAESTHRHLQAMNRLASSTLSLRGESLNVSQNLTGQLLNELRLDAELQSRLIRLRDKDPHKRIDTLMEIVKSENRLTPPAIYLMLSLRRAGALDAKISNDNEEHASPIPKKIVQYWDQKQPPKDISLMMRTWVDAHPGYQYCRFDNATARDYLANHYPAEVLNAYLYANHPAQKSDLFRLAYLFREGGFYIDADDRCVGSLSTISETNAVFIAYQEQYATLGNNFLGCIAGESVIGRALFLAVESLHRGDSDSIWLATGPGLLTRAFVQVLVEHSLAPIPWLQERQILDRHSLHLVSWPHAISSYKNTARGWAKSGFRNQASHRSNMKHKNKRHQDLESTTFTGAINREQ
jgi:tetratricopeptide (TPR) repeat protein